MKINQIQIYNFSGKGAEKLHRIACLQTNMEYTGIYDHVRHFSYTYVRGVDLTSKFVNRN